MEALNQQEPETQQLPIEKEELSKAALLDELRQNVEKHLEAFIKRVAQVHDIEVGMTLEALNERTGVVVYSRGIRLLGIRYTFAGDAYRMIGIDIDDTSVGSPATAIIQALTNDLPLRRAIPSMLRIYECAAALYRCNA